MNDADLQHLLDDALVHHDVVGASIAVLTEGELAAVAAAGTANVGTGVEVTPDTIFQIGSITKVYTSTLAMQLVDEGKLALDEPVATYLPEVRLGPDGRERDVTIAHLLSHTSGLFGDLFEDVGRGEDGVTRLLAACGDLPEVAPPGELVSYCNIGFVLLGAIIERLTGLPYHAAFRERLVGRIGADDTVVLPEDAILRPVAIGHLVDPRDATADPQRAPVWSLAPAQVAAGALPCATASDVLRFARLHLHDGLGEDGNRVLSGDSVRAMQQSRSTLPAPVEGMHGFGLGWMRFEVDGPSMIGHDGATIGNASFLRIVPEVDAAVALLTNGGRGVPGLAREVLDLVLREVADTAHPPVPSPFDDPSSVDLDAFVGSFANSLYRHTLRCEDGALVHDTEQFRPVAGAPNLDHRGLPARVVNERQVLLELPDRDGPGDLATLFDPDGAGRCRRLHTGLRAFNRTDPDAP